MISDEDIDRVAAESESFQPLLISARYHADSDRVELCTSWCTILVDRLQIDELRDIPLHHLAMISVSAVGLHIEEADIDINAGGLLAHIAEILAKKAAKSF